MACPAKQLLYLAFLIEKTNDHNFLERIDYLGFLTRLPSFSKLNKFSLSRKLNRVRKSTSFETSGHFGNLESAIYIERYEVTKCFLL